MIKKLFVSIVIVLTAARVWAGGCHLIEVTPSKELVARYMAEKLRQQIIEIEADWKSRGQTLQAVLIARSGESMKGLDVIRDRADVSLLDYMNFLTRVAIANAGDDNGSSAISGNRSPRIPPEMRREAQLAYSHMGILIKNHKRDPNANEWIYINHLLANCDKESNRYGSSKIFYETLDRFFWDTKMLSKKSENNKALVIVPKPEIQARLVEILNDKSIVIEGLHEPQYNVAATPFVLPDPKKFIADPEVNQVVDFQLEDQNSNQWPLEVLAAASQPTGQIRNRQQAQTVLLSQNYHPSLVVPVGIKESLACSLRRGPLGMWDASNLISCKNQVHRRYGIVQLITVASVENYLTRNNLIESRKEIEAPREKLEALDKLGQIIEGKNKKDNKSKAAIRPQG